MQTVEVTQKGREVEIKQQIGGSIPFISVVNSRVCRNAGSFIILNLKKINYHYAKNKAGPLMSE